MIYRVLQIIYFMSYNLTITFCSNSSKSGPQVASEVPIPHSAVVLLIRSTLRPLCLLTSHSSGSSSAFPFPALELPPVNPALLLNNDI